MKKAHAINISECSLPCENNVQIIFPRKPTLRLISKTSFYCGIIYFFSLLFKIVPLIFNRILLNLKIVITKENFNKNLNYQHTPLHSVITECPLCLCSAFCTHSRQLHNYSVQSYLAIV